MGCTHILRDLVRRFDEAMTEFGLEYAVAFGTLLGLYRADAIIPWTSDNDIIIPDVTIANTMVTLWDTTNATLGLSLVMQDILRVCINPQFAGGKLKEWKRRSNCEGWLYNCEAPYIDFYVGKNYSGNIFGEIGRCRHYYSDVFPAKKTLVYNGTFSLRFPQNPEQLLRSYYGTSWKAPPSHKDPHGKASRACPYGPSHGRKPVVESSPEKKNNDLIT